MTVVMISSPSWTLARPQVLATTLIASVAFRVKMTSWTSSDPMKRATLARAASKASVERIERVCMPRWTLLLSCR